MIKWVTRLRHFGIVTESANHSPEWRPTTLIYAENGRGKSTITAAFRAANERDTDAMLRRQKIGCEEPPEMSVLDDENREWGFHNREWSGNPPPMLIFDADFVSRNVHVDFDVTATNRQNLVDLTLGSAENEQRDVEQSAEAARKSAAQELKLVEAKARADHEPLSFDEFAKLSRNVASQSQLDSVKRRIELAERRDELAQLPQIAVPAPISFDPNRFLETLSSSVELDEQTVVQGHRHVGATAGVGASVWLESGLARIRSERCPLCNSSVENSEVIAALRAYFSEEYKEVAQRVTEAADSLFAFVSDEAERRLTLEHEHAVSATRQWQLAVGAEIPSVASLNDERVHDAFDSLRSIISNARLNKLQNLTDRFDTTDLREKFAVEVARLEQLLEPQRVAIAEAKKHLREFSDGLSGDATIELEKQRLLLEKTCLRWREDVVARVDAVIAARQAENDAKQNLRDARETLRRTMRTEFGAFETDVNRLLDAFGADFALRDMKPDFIGGKANGNYKLELAGAKLPVRGADGRFREALSEGDKRTLALAFFLVRVHRDPNASEAIVVVDDPMTSMDVGRRRRTVKELTALGEKVKQVVVLAHDAYFLHDLWKAVPGKDNNRRSAMRLNRSGNESVLVAANLDEIVDTKYRKGLRRLGEFVDKGDDHHEIARIIRPVLEEYLRRRYPIQFSSKMLGAICHDLRSPKARDMPYAAFADRVDEVDDIRTFGNPHHHGDQEERGPESLTDTEVHRYAKKTLGLIYS